MTIRINLEYFTRQGETMTLVLKDGGRLPMECIYNGMWTVAVDLPARRKGLEYSFEVESDGRTVRREWRGHHFILPSGKKSFKECEVRDCWHDRPSDSPFLSKAFTDVIFGRKASVPEKAGNLAFCVTAACIRKDETLAITGSGPLFKDWKEPVPMTCNGMPSWSIWLDAEAPFEFKFVILDSSTGEVKAWESGPNHFFAEVPRKGSAIAVCDTDPVFEGRTWRGAGTAIPVFSLRSEDSFGVGEFADIKKLADWAAMTGQSIIQLLPVNDTTMTGTWTDSYPYNANSTFALHPQFMNLPAAGVKVTKEYKALRKELNDLPEIDYEKVNDAKRRLLLEAFEAKGAKDMESPAYKAFYDANKHWLVPYASFCVLRDINGTPEFGKWKTNSVYSDSRIKAFCKKHWKETGFYCWEQFHLDSQLKDAVAYAHSKGIAIKGDLPIGISRTSAEAWQFPRLFNLDSQAGAPPDAFSADGQNWGFPTYNWEEMAKDGYAWWKSRLGKMSEYFDAFRIDHILGFFRIWEIPVGISSGLLGHFNPALPYSAGEIRDAGFDPNSGLFVPDPHKDGWYHPAIGARSTDDYRALGPVPKEKYDALYNDFFYHRHNGFWKETAMKKLPALLDSTSMLACGEDLGMIPACVPETMKELNILSLEIQRMPKSPEKTFDDPATYPYLSVCTTGTHDTSTLRGWWEEDREASARFFHEMLHCEGNAPYFCEPWVCEMILAQHLASPAMMCILPLQDWESVDGEVRFQGDPSKERINIPANPRHYWRWRMHTTIEDLMSRTGFNAQLRGMIEGSGR